MGAATMAGPAGHAASSELNSSALNSDIGNHVDGALVGSSCTTACNVSSDHLSKEYHVPDLQLTGTWRKDFTCSDSLDAVCDIMQLNGLTRLAIRLVRGIEINVTTANCALSASHASTEADSSLARSGTAGNSGAAAAPAGEGKESAKSRTVYQYSIAVFSIMRWFKVREKYTLDGSPAQFSRRDLRRGKHTARAYVQPGGSIRLDVEWGAPYAGQGYEELRLVTPNELHAVAHIEIAGQKHTYTTVYRREGRST